VRFEFIAGALCLDFANTIHDSRADDNEDELRSIGDALQWAREAGLLSSAGYGRLSTHYSRKPREATDALTKIVAIRDLVLALFADIANGRSVSAEQLFALNSTLARAPGLLRIRRDSNRFEAGWASEEEGLQQVVFAILVSVAELLASDRLSRVRECGSDDCTWLFVDESRNRSRRWCEMRTCGNRMKARRHYRSSKRRGNRRKLSVFASAFPARKLH
jgi:predicted RNA-binding Zn ribbon-like protein